MSEHEWKASVRDEAARDPWHGWHESSREDGGAAMYCPTHGHLAWRSCTGACEILRLVGKKHAGRLLDGREWNELPEDRA